MASNPPLNFYQDFEKLKKLLSLPGHRAGGKQFSIEDIPAEMGDPTEIINCLLWNSGGIKEQFEPKEMDPDVQIKLVIEARKPDIICFNELKASEATMAKLAKNLEEGKYGIRYSCHNVESIPPNKWKGQHQRGSSIFYSADVIDVRDARKAPSDDGEVEMVWMTVKKGDIECIIICCYAAPEGPVPTSDKLKKISDVMKEQFGENRNVVLVGDLNNNKKENKKCELFAELFPNYTDHVGNGTTHYQTGTE